MEKLRFIGLAAALFTSTGFIPQIIKSLKTKQVKDVALTTLLFTAVGCSLWTVYGFVIRDIIVIAANSVTAFSVIFLMFLKFFFKQN